MRECPLPRAMLEPRWRRPGSASSYNVRRQDARQEHVPSSSNSDAEMCLEAVRLRLRLLRSRMREVKNTADAIKLNGSELQTEVRRCCGELMRALEERQHVLLEAVVSAQETKLDALQRQANSIDSEARQLLKTETELEGAIVADEAANLEARANGKPSAGAAEGRARAAALTRVPRALVEAMRSAVERRPEDEVHGVVPCTSPTLARTTPPFCRLPASALRRVVAPGRAATSEPGGCCGQELSLVTDELLRMVTSLDFAERQVLMAPQNVAVRRETKHSLKIEWVAPPTIPSFPVTGYSVLVSEDDGTPEGGDPARDGLQGIEAHGHSGSESFDEPEETGCAERTPSSGAVTPASNGWCGCARVQRPWLRGLLLPPLPIAETGTERRHQPPSLTRQQPTAISKWQRRTVRLPSPLCLAVLCSFWTRSQGAGAGCRQEPPGDGGGRLGIERRRCRSQEAACTCAVRVGSGRGREAARGAAEV